MPYTSVGLYYTPLADDPGAYRIMTKNADGAPAIWCKDREQALPPSDFEKRSAMDHTGQAYDYYVSPEAAANKSQQPALSPVQAVEIAVYAPGQSADRLVLRQHIGRILCAFFCDVDTTMSPITRATYEANPMWAFYGSKSAPSISRRLYGVIIYTDGSTGYHAVTAHIICNNDVIGGVRNDDDMIQQTEWTEVQMATINFCATPTLFVGGFWRSWNHTVHSVMHELQPHRHVV